MHMCGVRFIQRRTFTLFLLLLCSFVCMFGSKHIRKKISSLWERKTINYRLIRRKLLRRRWLYAFARNRLIFAAATAAAAAPSTEIFFCSSSFHLAFAFFYPLRARERTKKRTNEQANKRMGERTWVWVCSSHAFLCSWFLFSISGLCDFVLCLLCRDAAVSLFRPLSPFHVFVYWFLLQTECTNILGHIHKNTHCFWWWWWCMSCIFDS